MDEKRNFTLLTDFYELTMMQGYFREKADDIVVFDAFYRKNPSGSGYAIACGLEQVIDFAKIIAITINLFIIVPTAYTIPQIIIFSAGLFHSLCQCTRCIKPVHCAFNADVTIRYTLFLAICK